ncbi:MAG: DUF5677 domain-containing protein [Planctomycetota bacterium]
MHESSNGLLVTVNGRNDTLESSSQSQDVEDLPLETQLRAILSGTEGVFEFAREHVVPVVRDQLSKNKYESVFSATYYRMCLWFEAIVVLKDPRHFQLAQSASRSLFELLIDVKLLIRDPTAVEQVNAFTRVERFRRAHRLNTFLNEHPSVDKSGYSAEIKHATDPATRVEIDSLREQHWGRDSKNKLIWPKHWSGKDAARRAADLGLEFEERYISDYSFQSWYTHPGLAGIAGLSGGDLTKAFAIAHLVSQRSFSRATEAVASEFRLFDAIPGLRDKLRLASVETVKAACEALMARKD